MFWRSQHFCLTLCFLACSIVSAEGFHFEERDWEVNNQPEEETKFVQFNNGAHIGFSQQEGKSGNLVGFNAEKDLYEVIGSDYTTIKSAHPNVINASAVILATSCGGNGSHCLIPHYYLVVPKENFLQIYYIGIGVYDVQVTLDENNQIADIQATVYVYKDKYLTRQFKTCRFIKDVGFVDPKTNSRCVRYTGEEETDYFLS